MTGAGTLAAITGEGKNPGYFGIGTAANGLGGLLQNMGFSTADVLALTAAGRLGFQLGPYASGENTPEEQRQASDEQHEKAAEEDDVTMNDAQNDEAEGSTSRKKSFKGNRKRKRKADPIDVLHAIAEQETAQQQGSSKGMTAGLDTGVGGLHLTPAAFLDALGLGGPGSGFGAGGLSGLLEGTGAHTPSIIVGPGGPNSAKSKKKAKAAAAAAASAAVDSGDGTSDAGGGVGPGGQVTGEGGASGIIGGQGGLAANGGGGAGGGPSTAAGVLAATIAAGPGGRLRWDVGKSLLSLTSAKDYEIESDLINIRKIGGKRRRR